MAFFGQGVEEGKLGLTSYRKIAWLYSYNNGGGNSAHYKTLRTLYTNRHFREDETPKPAVPDQDDINTTENTSYNLQISIQVAKVSN